MENKKIDDLVTNLSYIYSFVISKEKIKEKQEISELITESEVSSSIWERLSWRQFS